MDDAIRKADALIEALPYIRNFRACRTVLPLGGEKGEPLDLGRVGQVTRVDPALIESFADAGVVPVIPSLAYDDAGAWLNVNADTAAAAVAGGLKAAKLVFLTDTPGILRDR